MSVAIHPHYVPVKEGGPVHVFGQRRVPEPDRPPEKSKMERSAMAGGEARKKIKAEEGFLSMRYLISWSNAAGRRF